MSETMWDDEVQNALLDGDSLFCIGDAVVIQHTNPGAQGRIVGIYDPRLYYGTMNGQRAKDIVGQWAAYFGQDHNEVTRQRVYAIMFPELQDNAMISESAPEEVKEKYRVRLIVTPEYDIMLASQYWAEFTEVNDGETSS